MRAIVLTYDRQLEFAALLVKSYLKHWKDCPLHFRIPFSKDESLAKIQNELKNYKVEFIKTDSDIRSTMAGLLANIDDEEFVFWAIDDRYPIKINNLPGLQKIYKNLSASTDDSLSQVDSIKLFTHPEVAWNKRFSIQDICCRNEISFANTSFFIQKISPSKGFYIHHFTRGKVLKKYFLNHQLPKVYGLSEFHNHLTSFETPAEKVLIPVQPIAEFAEPCVDGELTINGFCDLRRYKLEIPQIPRSKKIFIYSESSRLIKKSQYRFFYFLDRLNS